MAYDVVVVGGGIGGLTVAALLSARGLSVCLLERQSQVGGCIGRTEFGGYDFDPGMGLYTDWGPGEIYNHVFGELPVKCPRASIIDSEYVVRLPDQTDVHLKQNDVEFAEEIALAFPECVKEATDFYRLVREVNEQREKQHSSVFGKALKKLWSRSSAAMEQPTVAFVGNTSTRFQQFIDAQLKAFLHTDIDRCAFGLACHALGVPRKKFYAIENGIATVAERLAESIKKSDSLVRLNTPVLRLAFDENGRAFGVDLLSGENVVAERAIISNLTIWDTYGKLVGLNRTPATIKSQLSKTQGSGAYLIYAALEDSALARLPSSRFLVAQEGSSSNENQINGFTVSVGEPGAEGKRPMTIKTAAEVAPWFSFQTSEEDYEEWDQAALTNLWQDLHRGVPELGAAIEVIESANPRTFYDSTRRKLGMVMGVGSTTQHLTNETIFPNVFLIGDTVSAGFGLPSITESAITLATRLTK
jgi:phytoene dehydrogenase-like protein